MISSISNQQVKEITKLQKQPKYRKASSLFIAEGFKMLKEAAENGCLVKTYISEFVLEKKHENLEWLCKEFPYETVSDQVFRQLSDTVTTQGILGIVKQPSYSITDILDDKKHIWLLLDDIRDPGNLGTIMRTAEGAGMSAVIMGKGTADLFNPKTVRSTMGAIFRMPFVYVDDITEIIKQIKDNGYSVYGTAMKGSITYDMADYTKGAGIVIGNEANGIQDSVLECITGSINIPMDGKLESLNAAVAAAVVMYEAARQVRRENL
ncbi:MAG: RNA methyltransferase [Lachnospiraceae bacterium]